MLLYRLSSSCLLILLTIASPLGCYTGLAQAEQPNKQSISGVYPHLAYWNEHGECGTGAVVPWANRLWVITYAPHFPQGSTDKLYEITPDLDIKTFEKSIGGTPANRMIHPETDQLLIGPYVIDAEAEVRVIPQSEMYGRLTGNARHLFEPHKKVYYATMEEGVYEVDLETLQVKELFRDDQSGAQGGVPSNRESLRPLMAVPGYHGKGLYSGQGRLIYANNGEHSEAARRRPDVPSGCLAEWDGKSKEWTIIRRNQFTDIRGPGGLIGNPNPETDPVWAIGWDHRSLLLMLLDGGQWYTYRLPKASHTYDGAHGWNTEWPRFKDIDEDELVMNMHGMFWRFPRAFSRLNSSGILPRSTYLKVIGDYCRWGDRLVFGCDDTARNEFLNTRRAKGSLEPPGQSHSNLWFTEPTILDELGPAIGRGSVWASENITANTPSDPFLFRGFERRGVHLSHESARPVAFRFEVDRSGNDSWRQLAQVTVPPHSAVWHSFPEGDEGEWIRVTVDRECHSASVQFQYSNPDSRSTTPDPMFSGIATDVVDTLSGGIVYVRGNGRKSLGYCAAEVVEGDVVRRSYYELDADLNLVGVDDIASESWALSSYAIPENVLTFDRASAIYVDDNGKRWRLPRGSDAFDSQSYLGSERADREVVTERDLFNCHGIFYELPARNAGGFAKIRPICTHNRRIKDYCSYRGLLIVSGIAEDAPENNPHIIRSEDGKVALWAGVVDDLWKFGKPVGTGGPWLNSQVKAGVASDPFLMTGFDTKSVALSHQSEAPIEITLQVDIDGTGTWANYKSFTVPPNETVAERFPREFAAYWIRAVCDRDTTASVSFTYE